MIVQHAAGDRPRSALAIKFFIQIKCFIFHDRRESKRFENGARLK
jgi:hypothetical protein